jgi:hypothetical protein
VSDVVVRGEVPPAIRRSVELWIGCVAGALQESEYRAKLSDAGFEGIEIEPTRIYRAADAGEFLDRANLDIEKIASLSFSLTTRSAGDNRNLSIKSAHFRPPTSCA